MKTFTSKLVGLLVFYASITYGQPGSLDINFGNAGIVTTDFGTGSGDFAYSVAIQPDGKIIIAGSTGDFALARYNADGTLDTSFSADGKQTTDFGTGYDVANSVALQDNGKIVVAGTSGYPVHVFTLAQYNTDGLLDTSFSTDGTLTTDVGTVDDEAFSIAIDANGKIVAAGYSYNDTTFGDFALVRYNAEGTLDASFSTDGKQTTDFGAGYDAANSVALQANGQIVVAGSSNGDFAVARYNSGGTLDSTFGTNGKITTDFGGNGDLACSVAIQPDAKIVVLGTKGPFLSQDDFALARYNPDGTLDSSFSTDGKQTTDFGTNGDYAYSVIIQSDGKIVAVGKSGAFFPNAVVALARYNTDGTLDNSFSADGKQTTDFGSGYGAARSVALQMDEKIVVAVEALLGIDIVFALARYNSDFATQVVDLATAKNSLSIFPNPASDKIVLEFSSNENGTMRITNTIGQIVFSEKIIPKAIRAKEEIEVSGLPAGMYLITIQTSSQKLESKFLRQ